MVGFTDAREQLFFAAAASGSRRLIVIGWLAQSRALVKIPINRKRKPEIVQHETLVGVGREGLPDLAAELEAGGLALASLELLQPRHGEVGEQSQLLEREPGGFATLSE